MTTVLSVRDRKNKLKYIIDTIIELPDKELHEVYNKFIEVLKTGNNKKNVSRTTQIKYIENSMKYLDNTNLITIEQIVDKCIKEEESEEQKLKRIALKMMNNILSLLDKPQIDTLSEFKNITRPELVSTKCVDYINDNKAYISECGFNAISNHEGKLKYPHLSIIKCMMKTVNCELKSKTRSKIIDDKRIVNTVYFIKES